MKKLLYILLVATLVGCSFDCDYTIEKLPKNRISFKELPDSVKTFIIKNSSRAHDMIIVNRNECLDYRFVTVKFIIDQWIDSYRLIDMKKNIIYKIDYSKPRPYILYNNNLYIPNVYINDTSDYYKAKFVEYQLK